MILLITIRINNKWSFFYLIKREEDIKETLRGLQSSAAHSYKIYRKKREKYAQEGGPNENPQRKQTLRKTKIR